MTELLPCTIETGRFRGWKALTLYNGIARIVAVPEIGGRIMAFDLGDYPFFFVDPDLAGQLFSAEEHQGDGSLAAWKNYGGDKTWPSPQGWDNDEQWHGPPDPVLDSGRYRVSDMQNDENRAWVEMVSPPDLRTGMQITRRVTLHRGCSRTTIDLSFKNISDKPRRWSIWDVAQLRAEKSLPEGGLAAETGCSVTAPLNRASRFPHGFWVMFGAPDNPQWKIDREQGLVVADYLWEIGKIGCDACAEDGHTGWVAFSNLADRHAFTERFLVFPEAEYPDNGSTVECWTVGKGKVANLDYENSGIFLMETEVLSPIFTFEPGETHSFQIEWGACRIEGRVVDVQPGGCASRKLAARNATGGVHLSGGFGVFDAGRLLLAWSDSTGEAVGSLSLGEASPNRSVSIDDILPAPTGVTGVELSLLPETGYAARLLGRCNLS